MGDDGLPGAQNGLGAAAVHIGHLQQIAAAGFQHIDDAGVEEAFLAGDRLVNHVGDRVRHLAGAVRGDGEFAAGQLFLLRGVHQPETDLQLAAAGCFHLADGDGLRAGRLPQRVADVGGLERHIGHAGGVHHAEGAGNRQVVLDHRAQAALGIGFILNGTTAMAWRLAPPPTISMVISACAPPAATGPA